MQETPLPNKTCNQHQNGIQTQNNNNDIERQTTQDRMKSKQQVYTGTGIHNYH